MATTRSQKTAKSIQRYADAYQCTNDGICAALQPAEGEARPDQLYILRGIISTADLLAGGVDIDFQVRIGVLVPVSSEVPSQLPNTIFPVKTLDN